MTYIPPTAPETKDLKCLEGVRLIAAFRRLADSSDEQGRAQRCGKLSRPSGIDGGKSPEHAEAGQARRPPYVIVI